VAIELRGHSVQIDRVLGDDVADALLHLVRNAIDHGLEPPPERARRGKPPALALTLAAATDAAGVLILVADDGAGIDVGALTASAAARGVAIPPDPLELVFAPGVTTRAEVTPLSGRGVGLDAVRAHVERLGGRVSVASTPGRGTRFTLALPPRSSR